MGGWWESHRYLMSFADEMWRCCGQTVLVAHDSEQFVCTDSLGERWTFAEPWTEVVAE